MKTGGGGIKVMVVDDSALMRKMIPMIISSDNEISVVGTAMDGDFALKKIPQLRPDVITLDMDMPRMDGIATLSAIVKEHRIPVILVSSLTVQGAEITLKGLEMGAFDFVPKPNDAISVHISDIADELIKKIKAAALSRPRSRPTPAACLKKLLPVTPLRQISAGAVVAIGISTGGPQSLAEVLPALPAEFPAAIVIVQHMPEGFTDLFARRLDSACDIRVREACSGDIISPGSAYIAPGGRHLKVKKTALGLVAILSQSPPVSGHRPSATVLLSSVAEEIGKNAIGVIMTGMGSDGVEGLARIKGSGGVTIAQDEKTSVIYGMPKAAAEQGHADMVLGLHDIVPALMEIVDHDGVKAGCRCRHIETAL